MSRIRDALAAAAGNPGAVRTLQVVGLAAFLVAWEIGGAAAPAVYSQPSRVLAELRLMATQDDLLPLVWESVSMLTVGLIISLLIGLAVGVPIGLYHTARVILQPYLAAYYSVPLVAFVPLMVVWFGIGHEFVIASVIASTAAVLVFATAAGVRVTAAAYAEVAASFQLRGWTLLMKVLLPGAAPFVASGMRLGAQRALVAVLLAEFLVGLPGIGLLLREARVTLATDRLFATATLATLLGVGIVLLMSQVERRLSSWRPTT